jgi:thiaminase/transcriptional activator TenA
MGFSDELRSRGAHIWDREQNHSFVTGIGDGSLPLDNFRYYMRQDYVFLIDYCRAISLAVTKARSVEDMGWFARLIHETLNTEMALHVGFCEDFGISERELLATEPSPTTWAYTRHMMNTAHQGTVGEVAAVILPCAWGYCEIGQRLYAQGLPENQPLYAQWIETYNSPEFEALAAWLREFIDRCATGAAQAELDAMERAFMLSSQYEYMFWDAAWRMEEWPV